MTATGSSLTGLESGSDFISRGNTNSFRVIFPAGISTATCDVKVGRFGVEGWTACWGVSHLGGGVGGIRWGLEGDQACRTMASAAKVTLHWLGQLYIVSSMKRLELLWQGMGRLKSHHYYFCFSHICSYKWSRCSFSWMETNVRTFFGLLRPVDWY